MVKMPEKKARKPWSLVTRTSPLPGFRLSIGFTLTYLTVIVLIPLTAILLHGSRGGFGAFMHTVTAPRVMASYRVTLGSAAAAALLSSLFGMLLAWVLARYSFPGKRIVDAIVDLPFALPTAVAGIALATVYSDNGWVGSRLAPLGIHLAFAWPGVVIALVFVGLPFLVRTRRWSADEL